jgi:hypothetical protein
MERIFGRKYASSFSKKWIPIIHRGITHGSTVNSSEIISSILDIQLKKSQKEDHFFLSSYLLDVVCASRKYPSLGWKLKFGLPSIHIYCKMLWENKYREDYGLICNGLFSTIYQVLFGEEASFLSPEVRKIVKEYGDQYRILD